MSDPAPHPDTLAGLIASAMSNPHLRPEHAIHAWGDHAHRVASWLLASDWLRDHDAEVAAQAWDEGFTKAGRLLLGMDHEEWPPTPNPYREATTPQPQETP